jgi:hypothetical protein
MSASTGRIKTYYMNVEVFAGDGLIAHRFSLQGKTSIPLYRMCCIWARGILFTIPVPGKGGNNLAISCFCYSRVALQVQMCVYYCST